MIVVVTTFRLAAGVDADEFLAADRAAASTVAVHQPGFLGRATARSDDGSWLVELRWATRGDAAAMDVAAADAPSTRALRSLVDPASASRVVYEVVDHHDAPAGA